MILGGDALGRVALGQIRTGGASVVIPGEDTWHQPFSTDVVRRLPPYHASRQQFAAYVETSPFSEQWTQNRFPYVSLSEPVRPRRPLLTGLPPSSQQFASFVQFAPFREDIKVNEWFAPFSEPVRFKPRLVTANQWFGRGIEFPLTSSIVQVRVTFTGIASLGGVPTSNYKQILSPADSRKLIFAAEISPWTLTS